MRSVNMRQSSSYYYIIRTTTVLEYSGKYDVQKCISPLDVFVVEASHLAR